jgi:glycosidase
MVDFGYDVADDGDVDPLSGTLADFDRLLVTAHARGLKVILDFVPNHSSDRHAWFRESRASRNNPKRDWYLWREGAPGGGPPNNWISDFGGPAWTFDQATGQYYYHAFLPEQPDLNWRNPQLRQAMYDVLRFWLDRGVDGFRVDVLWHMIKAADFPDNPINPSYRATMGEMHRVLQRYSTDQPEVHAIAREMRRVTDQYGERLLIGEIYLPVERLMDYYGNNLDEVQLPFNFALIEAAWNTRDLAALIARYEAALPAGGWPNWVLGNHDRPRIAARLGREQARVAALLLLTLRGTPTMYYGDELGLNDAAIPRDRVRDPRELREPNLGLGRDPQRTPMPWDGSPNAGFTGSEPWLPLNTDWRERNVEALDRDAGSILSLYRRLLALRRSHRTLSVGDISLLKTQGDTLAYERVSGDARLLVALNLGATPQIVSVPLWARSGKMLLSTLDGSAIGQDSDLVLRPDEGVIIAPANS